MEEEFLGALDLVRSVMRAIGIQDFWYRLSLGDPENKAKYIDNPGAWGRDETLFTLQLDFALPDRFDLTYIDGDGTKQRPLVIHRSSIGCDERTLALLQAEVGAREAAAGTADRRPLEGDRGTRETEAFAWDCGRADREKIPGTFMKT